MILGRFVASRWTGIHAGRARRAALDRAMTRQVLLALVWAAAAALWEIGRNLEAGCLRVSAITAPGITLGTGGLFAWAWSRLRAPASQAATGRLLDRLKPLVPQILSYLTLALGIVSAAALIVVAARGDWVPVLAGAAVAALVAVLVFFDPAEVGLHAAYRSRIARAFLGSKPLAGGATNRFTEECAGDDFPIAELREQEKPLHLVCCAANDLAGDRLKSLSRGARSAVLSGLGLSVGDRFVDWGAKGAAPPSFASALTASAAAFNPCMGSKSIRLGPVVGFLLATLNLRLGLWVRTPREGGWREWFPGLKFFGELLGQTRADRDTAAYHLSDGGHFENMGIYELVRRHCRYVIASDCGQDAEVAFDDVGNALRRIREDFGVEIEIDLAPLRRGEGGLSRQHVAVGEIRYGPNDRGVLILLKPTLTGDEPGDVLQYHTRNAAFPHESTGDQFYDEAQWESYRSLGRHVVVEALRAADRIDPERRTPDAVFPQVRLDWYPTPPDLDKSFLALTDRCAAIEERVNDEAPKFLVAEVYPEIASVTAARPTPPDSFDDWQTVVHLLLLMGQLMEDVWVACRLDTHFNHPLNLGWMSYFQRWANAPSFRMWWPILRPIYSPGFRRFAEEQFDLAPTDPRSPEAADAFEIRVHGNGRLPRGVAASGWKRERLPSPDRSQIVFDFMLFLRREDRRYPIQAAIAAVQPRMVTTTDATGAAQTVKITALRSTELYVPPGLWGAGIGSRFLRRMLERLAQDGFAKCRVELVQTARRFDEGSRAAWADLVEFYLAAGFTPVRDATGRAVEGVVEKALP